MKGHMLPETRHTTCLLGATLVPLVSLARAPHNTSRELRQRACHRGNANQESTEGGLPWGYE